MKTLGELLEDCRKIALAKIRQGDFEIESSDDYYMKINIDGEIFDIWTANGEPWLAQSDNFRVQPLELGELDEDVRAILWQSYMNRSN